MKAHETVVLRAVVFPVPQQACQLVSSYSQVLYSRFDHLLQQLLQLSQGNALLQLPPLPLHLPAALPLPLPVSLPAGPAIGHWLVDTFASPASVWGLVCLLGMVFWGGVANSSSNSSSSRGGGQDAAAAAAAAGGGGGAAGGTAVFR